MVDVTHIPASGGASKTFKGLFQDAGVDTRLGMLTASEPLLTFETAYCQDMESDDIVVIGNRTYRVRDGGDFKDATAKRFRIRETA